MQIRNVHLHNFCQHGNLELNFAPGTNCIIGRNGSGKSNLLKAICFALTGVSGNAGKREDDLKIGEEKGKVELQFSAAGVPCEIVRHLKTSSCTMKHGTTRYPTATEADKALLNTLGANPKTIANVVFAKQGGLSDMLFQTSTERAKAFQALFGTADMETMREVLHTEAQVSNATSRADLIKQLRTQIDAKIDPDATKLKKELEALTKQIGAEDDIAAFRLTVKTYERQELQKKNRAKASEFVGQLENDLSSASLSIDGGTSELQRSNIELIELKGQEPAWRLVVEQFRKAQYESDLRAQLWLTKSRAETCLAQPQPARTVDRSLLQQLLHDKQNQHTVMDMSRQIVASLKDSKGTCPTCTQPLPANFVEQHRCVLVEQSKLMTDLCATIETLSKLELEENIALQRWSGAVEVAREQLKSATQGLERLGPDRLAELRQSAEAATVGLTKFGKLLSDIRSLEEQLAGLRNTKTSIENQLIKARLMESDNQPGEQYVEITERVFKTAKESVAISEKAQLAAANLTGQLQALHKQREQAVAQIKQHEEDDLKMGPLHRWRELLERARVVLHRDQLPGLITRSYIKGLGARMSYYLEMFDADFAAEFSEDLGVLCHFSGKDMPAERLSGGQKVVLGIAFRFAVHDLFASNLGLLILDEPTVFLDKENVRNVGKLFEEVKRYSKSAGLQLIVVTHEERLAGVFDQTIGLG